MESWHWAFRGPTWSNGLQEDDDDEEDVVGDAPGNWLNIMGCSAGLFQNGVLFPKTLGGLS